MVRPQPGQRRGNSSVAERCLHAECRRFDPNYLQYREMDERSKSHYWRSCIDQISRVFKTPLSAPCCAAGAHETRMVPANYSRRANRAHYAMRTDYATQPGTLGHIMAPRCQNMHPRHCGKAHRPAAWGFARRSQLIHLRHDSTWAVPPRPTPAF